METALDKGYRVSGAVVNLAAVGVANATVIFAVSNTAVQIGTKSFKPRKLRVQNLIGGQCWLYLGTGVAGTFVARIPAVLVLNNIDSVWQEVDLPDVEFFASMTAYPDALPGGGSLNCIIEAEEIG